MKPLRIRSFVAAFFPTAAPIMDTPDFGPGELSSAWIGWQTDSLRLWFHPRDPAVIASPPAAWSAPLLLGDDAEWDDTGAETNFVNAVPIRYDAARRTLTLHTSIVALPPVFVHRSTSGIAIASDLYLLARLPQVRLELDPVAVEQVGRIGHPVGHRTLFKYTQIAPAGMRLAIGGSAPPPEGADMTVSWTMPPARPVEERHFIEAQIDAFRDAIRRMDVSRSVLSLTAGLDTRTVFAALADEHRLVPAVTMTGVQPSLDARTAARLCRAYGTPHRLVTFDDGFARDLPRFVEEASRLSGGLEGFEQAPEIYFYQQLGGAFGARVSGNLGNQVGRGGTEGVGVRGAAPDILSTALRTSTEVGDTEHWLLSKLDADASASIAFILQQEVPFSLVGNFCVGNHFAIQQSPYANRALLETLPLKPASMRSAPSGSVVMMRLRDLNHRFLGEPATISFQRTLLQRLGGFAATCPINYGWRARGGVSLSGFALGTATLFGMVAQKKKLDEGLLAAPLARTGIPALHNFRQSARWLRKHLREFTRDTLSSRRVRDAGLFEPARLNAVIDEHFGGRVDHHDSVTFALDLALAHNIFCARRL